MANTMRLLCLSVLLVLAICQDELVLLQLKQKIIKAQLLESPTNGSSRPCECAPIDLAWQKPSRTLPKCIFVDLGAADGNSFPPFLQGQYGPVADCGGAENPGDYEIFLVEANPHFDTALINLSATGQGRIHAVNSTAVYMCNASASLFIDDDVEHNHWGSSMDGDLHSWDNEEQKDDSQHKHKVTVPTMNLMQFLYEHTIPDDRVIIKMDIEGAEWDIVPCLATSPVATLVDQLYMEEHPIDWQLGNTTKEQMDLAKQNLTDLGVQLPAYYSETL